MLFCLIVVALVIVAQHFIWGGTDPDYNIVYQFHRVFG